MLLKTTVLSPSLVHRRHTISRYLVGTVPFNIHLCQARSCWDYHRDPRSDRAWSFDRQQYTSCFRQSRIIMQACIGRPNSRRVSLRLLAGLYLSCIYIHVTSILERGSARVQNGRVSTRGTNMCKIVNFENFH